MLITAKHVDDALASGAASLAIPDGAIVTPAARDRAREVGIAIGGNAATNGYSASANGSRSAAPAPAAPPSAAPAARPAPMAASAVPRHEIDIKPNYFQSPAIDNLYTIALELGAAVWVVKDRLRVIEEMLDRAGVVTTEQVEMYRPTTEQQKELIAQRNSFIEKLYGIIKDNPG